MDKKYVICPQCGKKLFKIDETSTYKNIYVWCKYCRKEIKMTEPRAESK